MSPPEADDYATASTDYGPLTAQQAENIADLAARRAEARLVTTVGRSTLKGLVWLCGALGTAFIAWLTGLIHFGHK
jgi:hypothetical protein